MRAADMLGSGTISGPSPESYGSMLEMSWKGSRKVLLPESNIAGNFRTFLEDGDTVFITGFAQRDGIRIGLGSLINKVAPSPT